MGRFAVVTTDRYMIRIDSSELSVLAESPLVDISTVRDKKTQDRSKGDWILSPSLISRLAGLSHKSLDVRFTGHLSNQNDRRYWP